MRSDGGGGGGIALEFRISSTDLWGSGSLGGDMRDFVALTSGELGTDPCELCGCEWW